MATIDGIRKALPKPSTKLTMMADGVDKMQSLEALANTDGGKILIKDLENLEESSINRLIQSLDSEATFDNVKGMIAELKVAQIILERIDSRKHL